jgi:hypothetical protein
MVLAISMSLARRPGARRILKSPFSSCVTAIDAGLVTVATAPAVLVTVRVVDAIKVGSGPIHDVVEPRSVRYSVFFPIFPILRKNAVLATVETCGYVR